MPSVIDVCVFNFDGLLCIAVWKILPFINPYLLHLTFCKIRSFCASVLASTIDGNPFRHECIQAVRVYQ